MPKRLRKYDQKKHRKLIKKRCQNGAKIDGKSMKNRCRNGRRRRDEKRTFEVRISIKISNSRILKMYENHWFSSMILRFCLFLSKGARKRKCSKRDAKNH